MIERVIILDKVMCNRSETTQGCYRQGCLTDSVGLDPIAQPSVWLSDTCPLGVLNILMNSVTI